MIDKDRVPKIQRDLNFKILKTVLFDGIVIGSVAKRDIHRKLSTGCG